MPDVILISILSTLYVHKTCFALVFNMAYYNISQLHDIGFNVMTLFKLFIVYSYVKKII